MKTMPSPVAGRAVGPFAARRGVVTRSDIDRVRVEEHDLKLLVSERDMVRGDRAVTGWREPVPVQRVAAFKVAVEVLGGLVRDRDAESGSRLSFRSSLRLGTTK